MSVFHVLISFEGMVVQIFCLFEKKSDVFLMNCESLLFWIPNLLPSTHHMTYFPLPVPCLFSLLTVFKEYLNLDVASPSVFSLCKWSFHVLCKKSLPDPREQRLFFLCFQFKIYIWGLYTYVFHVVQGFIFAYGYLAVLVLFIESMYYLLLLILNYIYCMCMMCGDVHPIACMWGEKTSFRSWLAALALAWVQEIRPSDFLGKCLYPPSPSIRPSISLFEALG